MQRRLLFSLCSLLWAFSLLASAPCDSLATPFITPFSPHERATALSDTQATPFGNAPSLLAPPFPSLHTQAYYSNAWGSLADNPPAQPTYPSQRWLTFRPSFLLMGFAVGHEASLSRRWAWHNEANIFGFWYYDMLETIALSSHLKYYLFGQVGSGWYLRLTAVGGHLFSGSEVMHGNWYAGGGLGFGCMFPFKKSSRWHAGFDLGIKIVPVLNSRSIDYDNEDYHDGGRWATYMFLSPGSVFDIRLSVAYRL